MLVSRLAGWASCSLVRDYRPHHLISILHRHIPAYISLSYSHLRLASVYPYRSYPRMTDDRGWDTYAFLCACRTALDSVPSPSTPVRPPTHINAGTYLSLPPDAVSPPAIACGDTLRGNAHATA